MTSIASAVKYASFFRVGSLVTLFVFVCVLNYPDFSIAQTATTDKPAPNVDQHSKLPLGISKTQPEKGRFVKLDDGTFMVPYETNIPGTSVKFTMVPIPAGTFAMGAGEDDDDAEDDERPQFNVKMKPFWMGRYEVTWDEYKKFMMMDSLFKALQGKKLRVVTAENKLDAITAPSQLYKPDFTYGAGDGPTQPAASMSQYAAKQYTKWLSLMSDDFYRLPYESEWEYACRAGTKTPFYFGDDSGDLDDYGWSYESSDDERHPAGQLKPNQWGLFDMYGNVAEWVLDEYNEDGYTHVKEGATVSVEEAFRKPTKLFPRVVRGGSFELEPEACRSSARLASDDKEWKLEDPNFPKSPWWFTDTPGIGVGFRLVRPLEKPKTREAMDEFWTHDIEMIFENATNRIKDNGKGAYGTVDPKLPDDIKALTDADK